MQTCCTFREKVQSKLLKAEEATTENSIWLIDLNLNLDSCHLFCILTKSFREILFVSYSKIIRRKSCSPKEVWQLLYLHIVRNEASFYLPSGKALHLIFKTLLRFENMSVQMLSIMAALSLT